MTAMGEALAAVFIIAGCLVSVLSAVGVLRFPDFYTRAHAASKSSALGVMCILTGAFLYFGLVQAFFSIRLLLAIFFVFLTAPVGAHVVLRAAHRSGVELTGNNPRDDLREAEGCACQAADEMEPELYRSSLDFPAENVQPRITMPSRSAQTRWEDRD